MAAAADFLLSFAASGSLVWFATRKAPKYLGIPPMDRLLSGAYCLGCANIFGNMMYVESYNGSARDILEGGEEDVKMELAKIILNNHSTAELLVEAVKRHFIAENLLSDQHQEERLFRWWQRNSYVDFTFKERMKDSEANNSDDDDAESSVNSRLFEDSLSLACMLATPGSNKEMSKPHEHMAGSILTRQELRAHRHRRASDTAVL